ncbi:MAG: hypothetical protein D6732_18810 [Methanobacteriota archaeon]|nr:MAG: hypothetical protein D6732_18810 [Euryarchaeota archaeon]
MKAKFKLLISILGLTFLVGCAHKFTPTLKVESEGMIVEVEGSSRIALRSPKCLLEDENQSTLTQVSYTKKEAPRGAILGILGEIIKAVISLVF